MARGTGRTVSRPDAFWDTSMLVPLCTQQNRTQEAVILHGRFNLIVWWATPVEISSALARLARMEQIDSADVTSGEAFSKKLADEWAVVHPSKDIRARASSLVHRYALRAADSLQLAAALAWCESQPAGHIFLTDDGKLREAARLSGFDTSPL